MVLIGDIGRTRVRKTPPSRSRYTRSPKIGLNACCVRLYRIYTNLQGLYNIHRVYSIYVDLYIQAIRVYIC